MNAAMMTGRRVLTDPMNGWWRRHRGAPFPARWATALGIAYAAATAVGLARWLARERPTTTTPAFAEEAASGADKETNFASMRAGAVVRASSWDPFRRHHPLFVIDEEPQPSRREKWAPLRADRTPWIEVRLTRPAHVNRVALTFAAGTDASTVRAYTVRCFAGVRELATKWVDDERLPIVSHDLACDGADAVRVELDLTTHPVADSAYVYEIEVWGRR